MNKSQYNPILMMIVTVLFGALISGQASAKSLYVIADINGSPTPIQTYDIQPAPAHLVFQAESDVPRLAGGAVGIGLDEDSEKLFITYEVSNTIQLVDAKTFEVLSQTTAPGAFNLAGIVVDQGNSKVYTVDRDTANLYVYSWVSDTDTLTLDGGAPVTMTGVTEAHGIALDETRGRLYVGDAGTTTVRWFDTSTFGTSPVPEAGSVDLAAEGQTVQGIAIDSLRNILYTGNSYGPLGSLQKLVKYDLNTDTISAFTLPTPNDNIVGLAVDEDTGNVYATTGDQGFGGTDTLMVFDSDLNILKDDLGVIGNPTGLVIPRTQISFNPLNFSKADDPDPVPSLSNLTYTLCYDNTQNEVLDVTNVSITDTIPVGTTFVSATGSFATTPTTVTWDIGTVAAGAAQACVDLVVNVTAPAGDTILNSATITGTIVETPIPTTVTETTDVGPAVIPPVFSKTADMDSVPSGSDLTYELCYDNSLNPLDVDNVTITDDIPAGTTFVDATGSFSTTPTTVTWSIGTVAAGAAQACVELVVNVTAPAGDTIQNTATISGTVLGTVVTLAATEDTAVSEAVISEVVFKGEGEGGKGSTGLLELLFGLLCLPLILARRAGRRINSLVMAGVLVSLVGMTAPSAVMAADTGWYAGAGIGGANTDVSSGDYDRKLAALGYTASSDIDDTDTGWKLFGGYRFTENWAIEGAYVDLGDVTSDTVVSSGPDEWTEQNFVDAAATVHPYSVDGIAITGVGTWPFGNGFSVFGKLGIFFWEADIKVECVGCIPGVKAPDDEDGTDITGGLGVGYDFANNFGVRAEWERFASDRDDVDLLSISVLYRF